MYILGNLMLHFLHKLPMYILPYTLLAGLDLTTHMYATIQRRRRQAGF
jgi:hypothetical protein